HGDQALSVEGILYRDEAAAKQAFAELRRARTTCPKGYTPSRVADQEPERTQFHRVPARFAAVPGVDRLTFAMTETARGSFPIDTVVVYQRLGPVVVGLYGIPEVSNAFIAKSIGGMSGLADTLARRMLANPAGGVT